jgi:hypothetical protein
MQDDARTYEKDWPGLPVKYLILSTKDFIVFIDHQNDLDWVTSDEYDQRPETEAEKKEFNQIMNEVAHAESIPCHDIDDKIIISFKRQIGESLVRAFEKDFQAGKQMIKTAQQFMINRNIEQSRFMYLASSAVITAAISGLAFICWLSRDFDIRLIGETAFYGIMAFLAGALGAFLSIMLRMGKTNLDYNASKNLHYMEAASRICAGMISGLLIGLCIKCGIFFSVFNKVESTHLAMIIGGLIAGCSERLAPSIIKKLDGTK